MKIVKKYTDHSTTFPNNFMTMEQNGVKFKWRSGLETESRQNKTQKTQYRKLKNNTDPTKKPGMNPGAREG
jgi:hypothetical protein